MRRGIGAGAMLLALAGCGPDWQPSWNMSSAPVVTGDSLTIRRVTGEDPEFEPLRSESIEQLRLSAGALLSSRPASVPPPVQAPAPRREPPVAEPPQRDEPRVVDIPGQPPAVVTGGNGRVQGIVQPGNPAGGVAIQDGGTTTIIQPGGRVTTVPTPR